MLRAAPLAVAVAGGGACNACRHGWEQEQQAVVMVASMLLGHLVQLTLVAVVAVVVIQAWPLT